MCWYMKMNQTLAWLVVDRNKFYSSLHVNNNEFALLTPGKFWEDFLQKCCLSWVLKDEEITGQKNNQCVTYRNMKEPDLCEEFKVA